MNRFYELAQNLLKQFGTSGSFVEIYITYTYAEIRRRSLLIKFVVDQSTDRPNALLYSYNPVSLQTDT